MLRGTVLWEGGCGCKLWLCENDFNGIWNCLNVVGLDVRTHIKGHQV